MLNCPCDLRTWVRLSQAGRAGTLKVIQAAALHRVSSGHVEGRHQSHLVLTVFAPGPPVPDSSPAHLCWGACLGNQQTSSAKGRMEGYVFPEKEPRASESNTLLWPRSPNFCGLKGLKDLAQVLRGLEKKTEAQRRKGACRGSHSNLRAKTEISSCSLVHFSAHKSFQSVEVTDLDQAPKVSPGKHL